MMGAAMLKRHRFVQSFWALYRLVVSSITFVRHLRGGVRPSPCCLPINGNCVPCKGTHSILLLIIVFPKRK